MPVANPDDPWASLVASIQRRRAPGARFFKPVCVISAIDVADEAVSAADIIDADAVLHRFWKYVSVIYPERADLGWRPLWHLYNDGLWIFHLGLRAVTRDAFGSKRKPDTRMELMTAFDRLVIAPDLVSHWLDREQRTRLRLAMLKILARDFDPACPSFARQLYDPALAFNPEAWPREIPFRRMPEESREQLDLFGKGTGVEAEDASMLESGRIAEPFDPDSIDVQTKSMTVDLLLQRVSQGAIDLQPDFQRRWGIWDAQRQSRLIESLLLRIPLPVIYAAEDMDDTWEIVDGIQRLSTIARFMQAELVGGAPLSLSGLEYLQDYDGFTFEGLGERLKRRLRETELQVHLIRKGTPPQVKFNVFGRVNTGGVRLSPQELRHAITPGPARKLLEDWADTSQFLKATDASVSAIRMDDRELVLRFLAFHILGPASYLSADMDGFLTRAMRAVNQLTETAVEENRDLFLRTMDTSHAIFGVHAFRKPTPVGRRKRPPINKALFETISVNLARYDADRRRLIERKAQIRAAFSQLASDHEFDAAISQGTGDVAKVHRRFAMVGSLIESVIDAP